MSRGPSGSPLLPWVPELEARHAMTSKTTESNETSLIYAAITNSETEPPGRNNHVLVLTGIAVAITAGIDQTPVDAIRGKHIDKTVFSTYKSNGHRGLKTLK